MKRDAGTGDPWKSFVSLMEPPIYTVWLPAKPASVAVARLMVRAALWDWHLNHLADTAQLIISELVTNALTFGTGAAAMVFPRGEALVIEVTDDCLQLPEIVDAASDDEHHRGLVLVDALATKWGTDLHDTTKTVWAHLEYGECDESKAARKRLVSLVAVPDGGQE